MGFVLDCVFPTVEKLTKQEAKVAADRQAEQLEEIEGSSKPEVYLEPYEKLIEEERERLKSVEARLAGILGLTSITATLLVSGTMALVNSTAGGMSSAMRGLATVGLVYLSLQIICSTLAAVRGLGRANWLRAEAAELIQWPRHDSVSRARSRTTACCLRYQSMDRTINFKVTQMAIAYTAIRNFAVGSVMIAALGLSAVFFQKPGSTLANAIRKDAGPREILRGPQGPQGPPGATGPSSIGCGSVVLPSKHANEK